MNQCEWCGHPTEGQLCTPCALALALMWDQQQGEVTKKSVILHMQAQRHIGMGVMVDRGEDDA